MKLGDLINPEQYALEILNGIETVEGNLPEDGNEVEEALSLAKKALEKQIPKKPIQLFGTFSFKCPNCWKFVAHNVDDNCDLTVLSEWCPYCGQRLDWSEEND